jgi:multicomponent Na+:H+ antiporter subunit D
MTKLGGIAKRMPVTGTTSAIAFLSTAGIPPLSGFWSKFAIILAAWNAGHPVVASVAILASIFTLAYFLLMQRKVFFGKLAEEFGSLSEASGWIIVPSVLLALVTMGLGFSLPWLFETYLLPVRSILL